jgi:tetratricopeptide (TPR) repeat protein
VQWGTLGLVAAGVLFVLSRSLCRPPAEPGPLPVLAQAQTDLGTVTRLLGDVALDSATRALFPSELRPALTAADTFADQRRWHDAINAIQPMLRDARPVDAAALHGLAGYLYHKTASPDWALREFRRGLAAAETSGSKLVPWLAFTVGYLFQSHGFADSCIPYYERAERTLRDAAEDGTTGMSTALLANNLGVAYEALEDTAAAVERFEQAWEMLDTLADPKTARQVRDNLLRVNPRPR